MANLSRMGEAVMIATSLAGASCASVGEGRKVINPVEEVAFENPVEEVAIEPSFVYVDGEKRPVFEMTGDGAPAVSPAVSEGCSDNGCGYSLKRPNGQRFTADFGQNEAPSSTRVEGIPPDVFQRLSARIQEIIKDTQ